MLDSILIEITRRPMSYRTVIALTEPNETAFPASSWFPHVPADLVYCVDRGIHISGKRLLRECRMYIEAAYRGDPDG
jgi:hypothetical protein